MRTYGILRRDGWRSTSELEAAALRSSAEGERMADEVAWIRSYVLAEQDGSVGTFCVYQATSPEAIRRHAAPPRCPLTRSWRWPMSSSSGPIRRHGATHGVGERA